VEREGTVRRFTPSAGDKFFGKPAYGVEFDRPYKDMVMVVFGHRVRSIDGRPTRKRGDKLIY
jgi:hypothetical protein